MKLYGGAERTGQDGPVAQKTMSRSWCAPSSVSMPRSVNRFGGLDTKSTWSRRRVQRRRAPQSMAVKHAWLTLSLHRASRYPGAGVSRFALIGKFGITAPEPRIIRNTFEGAKW